MLEAARLNLRTQQVIHTGLPTGASGFEAGQHIAIKPNGGGDLGTEDCGLVAGRCAPTELM